MKRRRLSHVGLVIHEKHIKHLRNSYEANGFKIPKYLYNIKESFQLISPTQI